ncbi:hypothetical protein ACXYN8_09765 [Altererythrobacter sp. CAU 1778]
MKRQGTAIFGRRGVSALAVACAGFGLLAIPASTLALGAVPDGTVFLAARGSFASFTPATVDPRLAKLVAERSTGKARLMRFTPAVAANRPDRSVTVAVRVDAETARAISARPSSTRVASSAVSAAAPVGVRITPTRYDLGLARGYQSFSPTASLPSDIRKIDVPDLADFRPSTGAPAKPSRFGARIALEQSQRAGRAPRTIDGEAAKTVDVAGSYRVTRNLDVTAGVRYSQDRDTSAVIAEDAQDTGSVYVGTQFRF